METIEIRPETPADYRAVEQLTREAFWNLYVPGCDEHYYLHRLRQAPCFVPALDLVATLQGQLVGHIAYMDAQIVQPDGTVYHTLIFGPVSVLPAMQNRGIGALLIRHSIALATELGYRAIVIYGYPEYYARFGFVAGKALGITDHEGKYPYAMQVLPLQPHALEGVQGRFVMPFDYAPTPDEVEAFDALFAPKAKMVTASQQQFAEAASRYL